MSIQPSKPTPTKPKSDRSKLREMVRNRWQETRQAIEARAKSQLSLND
ncbi:MAG: hypothetical protein HC769_11160 [Cyanobacteria bacterium CRU_2_1]|nr:hypothetical protein [Cyanobacteria bacterium RU_5_0]NJR59350.1 hypothetical protein [Cyanobacteria bacterium CRU_2_1]